MAALNRAVNFAHKKGALLIASAGNGGINWDKMGNVMKLPAQLPHVVAVSATGPQFGLNVDGMAVIPNAEGLEQAYTDYGKSLVIFAGPGGSVTRFIDRATKRPLDRVRSAWARVTPGVDCRGGRANIFRGGRRMGAAHGRASEALGISKSGELVSGGP